MKNLPLGINTLSAILTSDMVYVDKTKIAWDLIRLPGRYFLSRPRRFGKSLFVDTLKEIFEGNKELFKGLFIYDKWDWKAKYPVIKIDFAGGVLRSRQELDEKIDGMLLKNAELLGIKCQLNDIQGRFGEIIYKASVNSGSKVVVLVDEYDKPILDNIDRPDIMAEMQEGVKNLYSVMKEQDAHLQFVFMTGVSKFSKVSLFSGINQLTDITIDEKFSTICGYTEADLDEHFADHLAGADRKRIQKWYNGYSWMGEPVYNPYDILLFIHKGRLYRNYWFETGNPNFLIKLFLMNRYFLPNLENLEVTEEIIDSFDVEKINPVTLLFQTGYLTIERTFTRRERFMFALKIPNMEVKIALSDQFINGYTDLINDKSTIQDNLYLCLETADIERMVGVIKQLFHSIPYRNFTNNDIADYEGYYASVLYAFFISLNASVIPEDVSLHGQADMTIKLGNHIYVMEIKVIKTDTLDGNPALDQIIKRGYAQKYRGEHGKSVHEVGLVFSRKTKNIVKADWNNQWCGVL